MVVHVLGVLPTTRDQEQIAAPEPTRLVADDVLTAVVRDAPEGVAPRRDDLLLHAHVLEQLVERYTVVPFQFGVAVDDDDQVRSEVLEAQRGVLTSLLDQFDGMQQVTVQVFLEEEAALREVLAGNPALQQLRAAAADESDVSARVQLGQEVAKALEGLGAGWRDPILDRLDPVARAVSEVDPAGQLEVVHAAFLVARADRDAFDEAVGTLRRDGEGLLRVRYVGPQPPYSFLEPARNGELAWA